MQLKNERNNRSEKYFNLLTAKDMSSILNVSRSFAYMLMQSGELPTVQLGRSVRVRPQDLEEFLERNTHQSTEAAS